MIPLREADLIAGFVVQAIFYGFYIATFILCTRWLTFVDEGWQFRSRQRIQWSILTLTILLFGFVTTDLATSSWEVLAAISGQESTARKINFLINTSIEYTILITIDAVLIFRCWVVCRKSWRTVCLPLLLWACTIACAMVRTCFWKQFASMDHLPPFSQAVNVAFLFCNLATNLYATCAIIYRVFGVAKINPNKARHLYNICQIVAGTGILYVVTSFTLLVSASLPEAQRNLYPIFDAVNFSMAGITFNLFLIQMGQLRASIANQPNSFQSINLQRTLSALRSLTPSNTTSTECRTVDMSVATTGINSRTLVASYLESY